MSAEQDKSVDEWTALLKSKHSHERSGAANEPPEHAPDDVVISGLLSCLNDPDSHVRTCAVDSLRNCNYDVVREALRRHIEREDDPLTISYVLSALGDIGSLEDTAIFVNHLGQIHDPRVRLGAAEGLAFCTTRFVTDHLIASLQNGSSAVRHPAVTVSRYVAEMQKEKMKAIVETLETVRDSAETQGLKLDTEKTLRTVRECFKGLE